VLLKLPILSDKNLAKMGRRTTFEVRSDVPSCNIGLVQWFDNKVVNLASNFITSGNTDVIRRWDKKNKTYVDVE